MLKRGDGEHGIDARRLEVLADFMGIADHLDTNRPRFLYDHLFQLGWSMQRGANVIGYIHWASIDNFEWTDGYTRRFGIVHVDFATQKRTPKLSSRYYSDVIRLNSVV